MSYSSDESGPLFVEDTFSDSDMEQSSEQQRHSNECICKEKVKDCHGKFLKLIIQIISFTISE